jgi:hypothetical protein
MKRLLLTSLAMSLVASAAFARTPAVPGCVQAAPPVAHTSWTLLITFDQRAPIQIANIATEKACWKLAGDITTKMDVDGTEIGMHVPQCLSVEMAP